MNIHILFFLVWADLCKFVSRGLGPKDVVCIFGIGGGLFLVSNEEVRSKEAAAAATAKDEGEEAEASVGKRRGAASRPPAVRIRKTAGAKHPFQSPKGTAAAAKLSRSQTGRRRGAPRSSASPSTSPGLAASRPRRSVQAPKVFSPQA
jgi:hypothetical protein